MPHEDEEEKGQKKTVVYKDLDLRSQHDRRPKRVVISKSRYKLYDQPQRSTFSICLDNIKRERQSISLADVPTTSKKLDRSLEDFQQPGPSTTTSFAHPDSSLILTGKRSLYFKDALVEYKRRRTPAPRRIKIIKVYAPLDWEEALEESVEKYNLSKNINHPWRQPRLQWLQQLEQEDDSRPRRVPRDHDDLPTPCCPLFMYPFRKRKSL
ncbi:uncharacterized protein LOC135713500 [Ochlerotatus camptorhynchus]|uniref:uncharacterized protein LOC135713500 n=1 Tax=Ochlerotatus camptorhynchus TaxID=644619 RepID=UPI0031D48D32